MGNTFFKTLHNDLNILKPCSLPLNHADAGVTCSLFGSIPTALLNTYEWTSSPGGGTHTEDALALRALFALILPELGREYCIDLYSMACMAYHGIWARLGGDQKMCAKCVLSLGVCVCARVCTCVNVNDRCARCRAHFSQREEHQAIYTRSSGGAEKSWLCANFEISLEYHVDLYSLWAHGWWKVDLVYEHNTERCACEEYFKIPYQAARSDVVPWRHLAPGLRSRGVSRRLGFFSVSWLVAVVHMSLDIL